MVTKTLTGIRAAMNPPDLESFDHVHVHVHDRVAAEAWYQRVLGLERNRELEFWATDGPLMVQNPTGSVRLALFQRPLKPHHVTIAMRVSAENYLRWKEHLKLVLKGQFEEQDHDAALSVYFSDPDGNPFEITTYEVNDVKGPARR